MLDALEEEFRDPPSSQRPSWRSACHSDWQLILHDKSFDIHRCFFSDGCGRSEVLRAQFDRWSDAMSGRRTDVGVLLHNHQSSSSSTSCLDWCESDISALEVALDYAYGEDLHLSDENAVSLLKLAQVLQMRALGRECVRFLETRIQSCQPIAWDGTLCPDNIDIQHTPEGSIATKLSLEKAWNCSVIANRSTHRFSVQITSLPRGNNIMIGFAYKSRFTPNGINHYNNGYFLRLNGSIYSPQGDAEFLSRSITVGEVVEACYNPTERTISFVVGRRCRRRSSSATVTQTQNCGIAFRSVPPNPPPINNDDANHHDNQDGLWPCVDFGIPKSAICLDPFCDESVHILPTAHFDGVSDEDNPFNAVTRSFDSSNDDNTSDSTSYCPPRVRSAFTILMTSLRMDPPIESLVDACIPIVARNVQQIDVHKLASLPPHALLMILNHDDHASDHHSTRVCTLVRLNIDQCHTIAGVARHNMRLSDEQEDTKNGPMQSPNTVVTDELSTSSHFHRPAMSMTSTLFDQLLSCIRGIGPDDAIPLLVYTSLFDCTAAIELFRKKCVETLARGFGLLADLSLVWKIPHHNLVTSFLNSDLLYVRHEDQVFDAVSEYIKKEGLTPQQIREAWSTVRFAFLSPQKHIEAAGVTGEPIPVRWVQLAAAVNKLEVEKTSTVLAVATAAKSTLDDLIRRNGTRLCRRTRPPLQWDPARSASDYIIRIERLDDGSSLATKIERDDSWNGAAMANRTTQRFSVHITNLPAASNVMVGFAFDHLYDPDGENFNTAGYFLHCFGGTLYSHEGDNSRQYLNRFVTTGEIIEVRHDIVQKTISFSVGPQRGSDLMRDYGVAFRNVDAPRGLFPCIDFASRGAAFKLYHME